MNRQRDLLQAFLELQISRRGEHGVRAENHQHSDLAGLHGLREVANRRELVGRVDLDGRDGCHRDAHVAQRLIDLPRQRVNGRRLIVARDDHRSSAMRLQILRDGGDPLVGCGIRQRRGPALSGANRARERPRKGLDLRGAEGQPMIRFRAGQRRRALDGVEAVHLLLVVGHPAAIGKVARIPHGRRAARQKIGVQRDDDVGFVEVIDGVGLSGGGASAVTSGRIPGMPLGLRERLLDQARSARQPSVT